MAPLLLLLLLAPGESLESRVNKALDSSAAHLVSKQAADGSWNKEDKVHPLGRTALCTYALLHAGYARDHPAVVKGLEFLSSRKQSSTYEAGCMLLLYHALGRQYDKRIHSICDWLVEHFDRGPKLWGYPDGTRDLSNTQYAVFGLKVGEMHGYRLPKGMWRDLITGAMQLRARDGAFRYRSGTVYRATMTHAALLILHFATKGKPRGKIKEAMDRGHRWFEKNYSVEVHPFGRGHALGDQYYYYMYGLERYAEIFGFKTIAGHDWYREGAEELLKRQENDGSWGRLENTCFAILFLQRVTFTAPRKREVGEAQEGKKQREQRPRPGEGVPFLRRWLVSGPYQGTKHEDDMLFERHFNPARLGGKEKWFVHESDEDKVDLKKACGGGEWCTFYAALYLHAERAAEPVLWIGTDDGFKLFLNGAQVFFGHHHDYSGDDHYRIPLSLKKGRNLLVVQVENLIYYAHFKARLTGADGVVADVRKKLRR